MPRPCLTWRTICRGRYAAESDPPDSASTSTPSCGLDSAPDSPSSPLSTRLAELEHGLLLSTRLAPRTVGAPRHWPGEPVCEPRGDVARQTRGSETSTAPRAAEAPPICCATAAARYVGIGGESAGSAGLCREYLCRACRPGTLRLNGQRPCSPAMLRCVCCRHLLQHGRCLRTAWKLREGSRDVREGSRNHQKMSRGQPCEPCRETKTYERHAGHCGGAALRSREIRKAA